MASLMRSMRMASWPLEFTRGFSPRIKLSATPPLSLGFCSEAEYLDVETVSILRDYHIREFKNRTIKGIMVKEVEILSKDEPPINELVKGFRYRIGFKEKPEMHCENIIESGEDYIVIDIYKQGGNIVNPRKIIPQGDYRITKLECLRHRKQGDGLEILPVLAIFQDHPHCLKEIK
jgi:radical SAM-linked protein